MQNLEIKKLDWDSKFWGFNIYNINRVTKKTNTKMGIEYPQNTSKYIIQELVFIDDVDYINRLEDIGFRFVDSKINLVRKVQDYLNIQEIGSIRTVNIEDLEIYKNEFFDLYGKVSRFSIFGEHKVNQFYYEWVYKSIRGELDDGCFGFYVEKDLAGFITYRIINQRLVIGLVGVFMKFQRRKISQYLLQYINNFALQGNCTEVCISTQGKNVRAINAYIKSGFYVDVIKNWYYLQGGL